MARTKQQAEDLWPIRLEFSGCLPPCRCTIRGSSLTEALAEARRRHPFAINIEHDPHMPTAPRKPEPRPMMTTKADPDDATKTAPAQELMTVEEMQALLLELETLLPLISAGFRQMSESAAAATAKLSNMKRLFQELE